MASEYDFGDKFRHLLKGVPDDYSLEQWQHAYRQAIFLMGMKILERFEAEATAHQARHERMSLHGIESPENRPDVGSGGGIIWQVMSHTGGPGPGGNPSIYLGTGPCRVFPDYPLALQPATEFKRRERSRK